MNIVHVLTEPRGGGGVYARTLAEAAAARGDRVRMIAPAALSDVVETVAFSRGLQTLRQADVVHCHGIRAGLAGFVPTPAAVVQTPNGVHQARSKQGAAGVAARAGTRAVLRQADLIVCVSEAEREFVHALVPSRDAQLRVVLNGVAAQPMPTATDRAAARNRLGLGTDQPVLLFVGGLRYQKNPQLAVAALARARARIPNLVLLVAGSGPLQAEVEAMATEGVVFLGERADVDMLLAGADAVLSTSRWEGLSLALLEALWAGRPLVVTDAPGNAEATGDAGFVLPNYDVEALAAAITELFSQTGTLERLSRRARARAEHLFSDERMVAQTLPLYDEAIAQRANATM